MWNIWLVLGQAELDKRRKALAEQQRREQEERERKEREEYERKEKLRLEQERRQQAELEKKLAKQREIEMVSWLFQRRNKHLILLAITDCCNRKKKSNVVKCWSSAKPQEKRWKGKGYWSGRNRDFKNFYNRGKKSRKKWRYFERTTNVFRRNSLFW